MSDLIANVVGSAAAICSITSFAPQAVKIWKERDASSVSLKTYSLTVTCFVLWVVYGVMTQAWPVTVANACALVMASGVLVIGVEKATKLLTWVTGTDKTYRAGIRLGAALAATPLLAADMHQEGRFNLQFTASSAALERQTRP